MELSPYEEDISSIPSCPRVEVEQRSRPDLIQPQPKRLKTINRFECILYREKWHAIKSTKAFFNDIKSVAKLMLFPTTKENTCLPLACGDELAFLVDTSKLEFDQDLTCDGTGKYKNSKRYTYELVVDNDQNIFLLKEGPKPGSQRYTLIRRYYPHRDTPGFFRIIYQLQKDGVLECPIALIRYEWRGQKTALTLTPQENCKQSNSSFIPPQKTSNEELKEPSSQSTQGRPDDKFQKQDTTVGNDAAASLQRDRQQIYPHCTAGKKQIDFNKLAEKKQFVRSIEISNDRIEGSHQRCVAYTDKQIEDMKRTCTAGSSISFTGPFDLGQMYVTVASYSHHYFMNKQNEENVIMPGPFLVHERRDTETYQYFGNQLSKHLGNEQVPFFRTDGDRAMFKGLKSSPSFSDSEHLLCLIHHRKNVESKLQELGLHKNTAQILRSIYGEQVDEIRYQGLADCENDKEYEEALIHSCTKWNGLETAETGRDPEFATWFMQHQSKEVKECMLRPVRQQTGLGDPRRDECECLNSLLAKGLGGTKSWNDLVDSLEDFVKSKYTELETSIRGSGEKGPVNKHLETTPLQWANMNSEERRLPLKSANISAPGQKVEALSISPEESGIEGLLPYELQAVWSKAEKIIDCSRSIVDFPSTSSQSICFDDKDFFKVSCQDDFFACDEQCRSFLLHNRLFCEHTLAVAEQKDKLAEYLCRINAKKQSSSCN